MGQVVKFFGWMGIGIAVTMIVFGHLVMVLVYNLDYLLETVWPSDPQSVSSIWFSLASFVPGGVLWLLGHGLQKFQQRSEAKEAAQTADDEQNDVAS